MYASHKPTHKATSKYVVNAKQQAVPNAMFEEASEHNENSSAIATFAIMEITDVVADEIGHNQIINILRGVCRQLRASLKVYRGYSLLDYFIYCREHFQSPLWYHCGDFRHVDGSKWVPTCGAGVGLDRISTKIYESILEYDANEYVNICHFYFNHNFAYDVIRRDKWRLFAATACEYVDLLLKFRPREIITRMCDIAALSDLSLKKLDVDIEYIPDMWVYKYDNLNKTTLRHYCKKEYEYPWESMPRMLVDIDVDDERLEAHANMFYNSRFGVDYSRQATTDEFYNNIINITKREILANVLVSTKQKQQIVRLAKFIRCLNYHTNLAITLLSHCWSKYDLLSRGESTSLSYDEFMDIVYEDHK